jgi:phosphate transport system permease protein
MAADAGRYTLTLSRRTKRRKAVNLLMQGIATVAALSAVAVLALVIASVAERGAGALSWDFFTKTAATFGQSGGGVANALVGSLVLVALATAMALPVGVLIAIYVSEFAHPRVADASKLVLDVLNGLPSIIIGVFVYGLLVVGSGQAAWKGSFALAIIMLPLVSRSTQEVLALVPATLREGALALGASRWRTVLGVVLPTSLGGILTGTVLAVARAAGETAPLLFVTSIAANTVTWDPRQPVLSIPVDIFALSESPDPADHARAWALALVLISFILVASLTARAALVRYRGRLER